MTGNSTSSSSLNSNSSSNSNSNSNSKAPKKSPASYSKDEVESPSSVSQSPPPPSASYSDSDSESESQSAPPPPKNSSPPPPPSPPPSSPPKSNNNDNENKNNNNDNNNSNDKSSPSSPPDNSSPSSPTSPSPPPTDTSSSGSSPPTSPPPSPPPSSSSPSPPSSEQSPSPPTPANNVNSGDGGDNDSSQSSTSPTVQQSPSTSPKSDGVLSEPAPPGAVPTTTTSSTPLFSPPTSPNKNRPSSSSLPSLANHGRGGGPPFSSSSSFSSSSESSSSPPVGIIAGVVAACLLLLLLAVVVICLRKKRRTKNTTSPGMSSYGWEGAANPPGRGSQYWQSPQNHGMSITPSAGPPMGSSEAYSGQHSGPHHMNPKQSVSPGGFGLGLSNRSTFTYEELAAATNGFDQANMLGQGGFGYVHKGLLPDGKVIAVKRLKSGSGQGEREFQAEVEIISRVHHRHLVSLVGYCIAQGQRMLVYEFLPNNTLEYHLHKKRESVLDFPTRLRIALGSAKGLAYLHEDCHPRIIHRDIKASNILLDDNFEAMVADFGLAKLTTDTNTHVSTRVMGTFGYLAPEYASSGKLTEKSDVFSFGVMLLELITGRRPVDPTMQYMEDSLVDWSRPLLAKALETGNYDALVDPRLEGNYNPQEMQRMVACAAASIRHSAKKRPKMSQIVRVLEGDVSLEDLNEGRQNSANNSSDASSEYDTRAYSADMKKFRQIAFATQDFASSEYGGSTSDYGLNPSSTSSSDSTEMKL